MPKNERTEFKKYSDQFIEFKFVIVKENKAKQTSEAKVYLEGFKVKKPPVTTNMEKILSAIEGLTSKVNEMSFDITQMKTEITNINSRIDKIDIKIEKLNSRMDQMDVKIENLNTRMDQTDLKIGNLRHEMNHRFDKLESRVSTLENFHKKDLDKK